MSQYDAFADIYALWTGSAPVTRHNQMFYVEEYLATAGPVVELGVGDGRIAVEAARRGKDVVGVDDSQAMLDLCQARARELGVQDRITTVLADMRSFAVPDPPELVSIPFHTIGHLVEPADRLACLRRVHDQLQPGGRLIFDAFVFDPDQARGYSSPTLRDEYTDQITGQDALLWFLSRYDTDRQHIRIVAWTELLDGRGVVVERRYRRLDFSWLDPDQARALLGEAGFAVEAVYGDFSRTPFRDGASEHVWVASKPRT